MSDLSQTMKNALAEVKKHGSLERRHGGFWTGPGIATISGVPRWYFVASTVFGLLDRRLLLVTERSKDKGEPIRVIAAPEGRRED